MTRYPNLFLAGAPKCGTTSMAYYLGQHPEIFAPVIKEPNYFGLDLRRPAMRLEDAEYFEIYSKWRTEAYALDASTSYFVSTSAADEIHKICPDAKIVIMIRNPVEAIYSQYFQNRYAKTEPCETFEAALGDQDQRATLTSLGNPGILEQHLYYRVYSYRENIERYFSRFGRENVKLVLLEDLAKDPNAVMEKITSFLKLGPVPDQKFPKKNVSKTLFLPQVHDALLNPPGWARLLAKWSLPQDVRIRLRLQLVQLTIRPKQNPAMQSQTRKMLEEKLAPEIEALSGMLDRNLDHWF